MHSHDLFLERALLEEGRLTQLQLEQARRHAADKQTDLVDALLALEIIDSRAIALTRADICEAPFIELADFEAGYANTRLIPRTVAERHCLFPLFMIDGVLTLAMDDPLNLEAMDQVRQIAKCDVDAVLCDRQRLRALIARAYSLSHHREEGDAAVPATIETPEADAAQPVVAAVNQILAEAVEQGASDIHINPDEYELRLRYRVDGVLRERQGPPLSMHASIVQRLKVMAHLDLTQTRRPQDGKFRFMHNGTAIDTRMSTVPTVCGENVVIRLLASAQVIHDFHALGVPARIIAEMEELLDRPYGIVLVTGPTGSGKTTTLYTALSRLNEPATNIMTVEDPVEIRLPYLRQIQVHPEINLTFASALRSILRQDPDVVLVGEMRDGETATIALQAALTGHLVLSTLHTNDAAGAVARLRDYGLPSFVINSAVLGVLAQRLVRRVCTHCAVPDRVDPLLQRRFQLEEHVGGFMRGKGCGRCGQTGYRGRVGIYELLPFTPSIQSIVESGGSTRQIREAAVLAGMRLMWRDGVEKARLGLTTLAEVAKAAAVVEAPETGVSATDRRAAA
jgi:type II secretory ATPase GspE/PulE/Tfp pilus assembly ATPase PilB-like protein